LFKGRAGEIGAFITEIQTLTVYATLEYPAIGGPVMFPVAAATAAAYPLNRDILLSFMLEPLGDIHCQLHVGCGQPYIAIGAIKAAGGYQAF
jgi:hypothetical protein